ncbi:hypothetical protein HPB50_005445 [Hyalomma asiaticum]|uniref:Uncharacterized protein n=1 Tax=Hyalomma asiaticum TaxID=266040 RepID=A0ACB7SSV7_HYAAI|nr:hypothetical protein HPB50_005445 [Hyalomma asiaticum]
MFARCKSNLPLGGARVHRYRCRRPEYVLLAGDCRWRSVGSSAEACGELLRERAQRCVCQPDSNESVPHVREERRAVSSSSSTTSSRNILGEDVQKTGRPQAFGHRSVLDLHPGTRAFRGHGKLGAGRSLRRLAAVVYRRAARACKPLERQPIRNATALRGRSRARCKQASVASGLRGTVVSQTSKRPAPNLSLLSSTFEAPLGDIVRVAAAKKESKTQRSGASCGRIRPNSGHPPLL